jgi:hypothetical protein
VAGNPYIASMGIYVMKADALKQLLLEDLPDANDFGNEIIPAAKDAGMRIQVPRRWLRCKRAGSLAPGGHARRPEHA